MEGGNSCEATAPGIGDHIPLTLAHGVKECRRVRMPLVISLTAMPLTRRASATSER